MSKIDAREIDFREALKAAESLVHTLRKGPYRAPELAQQTLNECTHDMNRIALALRLLGGPS